MSVHTYSAAISSPKTLYQSLTDYGVDMVGTVIKCIPEYSLNLATGQSFIDITTTSAKSVCDLAVSDSLIGTIKSNKEAKKKQISNKSTELVKEGLGHTTATGFSGVFPIESVKEELSFYNTVVDAMAEHAEEGPQIIPTVDGGGVPIMNIAEAKALSEDVRRRLEYIYSSLSPVNGSKSQLLLDKDINEALTQAELDLITDNRA